MNQYILFFWTKSTDTPATPFPKKHVERHDRNGQRCFIALIEDRSEKDAWYSIFRAFPDYEEAGKGRWEEVPCRHDHNDQPMERTFEDVCGHYGAS